MQSLVEEDQSWTPYDISGLYNSICDKNKDFSEEYCTSIYIDSLVHLMRCNIVLEWSKNITKRNGTEFAHKVKTCYDERKGLFVIVESTHVINHLGAGMTSKQMSYFLRDYVPSIDPFGVTSKLAEQVVDSVVLSVLEQKAFGIDRVKLMGSMGSAMYQLKVEDENKPFFQT